MRIAAFVCLGTQSFPDLDNAVGEFMLSVPVWPVSTFYHFTRLEAHAGPLRIMVVCAGIRQDHLVCHQSHEFQVSSRSKEVEGHSAKEIHEAKSQGGAIATGVRALTKAATSDDVGVEESNRDECYFVHRS